jgi:hypothetical protein
LIPATGDAARFTRAGDRDPLPYQRSDNDLPDVGRGAALVG